jgi:hypothetical protein
MIQNKERLKALVLSRASHYVFQITVRLAGLRRDEPVPEGGSPDRWRYEQGTACKGVDREEYPEPPGPSERERV